MHGKVFCRLGRLSIREQFEELGMAKQSIFGNISGYLNQVVVKLCLLELVLMWSEYVTCIFPNSRSWDPGKLASYFFTLGGREGKRYICGRG